MPLTLLSAPLGIKKLSTPRYWILRDAGGAFLLRGLSNIFVDFSYFMNFNYSVVQ